uniref:Uncharacterized protein n=1 Tax=Magallana gigas TaxID=29159 RepID=A0A8W8L5V1_MAGGI
MDLNERTFESLGNRLCELEDICGLNDTVSEKTDCVTLDLLYSSLDLSVQSVDEKLELVTLPPAGSVNRNLAEKKLNINIITDKEFKHSRDELLSKRKLLRQLGKGNREKRADPLTAEEIDLLYEKNLLGTGDPKSLINV